MRSSPHKATSEDLERDVCCEPENAEECKHYVLGALSEEQLYAAAAVLLPFTSCRHDTSAVHGSCSFWSVLTKLVSTKSVDDTNTISMSTRADQECLLQL